MNKFLLSILFTIISFATIQAQKEVTITGKVLEKITGQPLEYATVAFFSQAENRIVTGGITDQSGYFSIPVPVGTYDVSIEFISFIKQTLPNQNLNSDKNIGNFSLEADTQALDEVNIIAEKTSVTG